MVALSSDVQYAEVFRALVQKARTDFLTYLLMFNPPGSDIVLSDCHLALAELVQGVVDGHLAKRQATSMPPQHGKSTMLSKEAVSWIVGRLPGIQVALTSFSHELVTDFSKSVRSRVEMPLYGMIFPNATLHPLYNKSESWMLANGSGVRAKSVGKKLTGRRVDWLIIDDAHSGRREAESPLQRKRVREWYFGDCISRLAPNSTVFIIGTRWHPQDLIGHLTGEEYTEEMVLQKKTQELFSVTNMEAICTDADKDPLGREVGDALFPEVRNKQFLENIRAAVPEYEWQSQFQGKPQTSGSGQVDINKLHRIGIEEVPTNIEWFRGWDLALTENKTSDYSAGPLCAYDKVKDFFYIIDMFRDKLAWPRLKPQIVRLAKLDHEEHGSHRVGMEAVIGFDIGWQEVRQELLGVMKVEKRNPSSDKLIRAQPWFNKIEAGKVFLVRGEWNRDFINELALFPDGDHDDQVDGVSVAWEMASKVQKLLFA